MCRQTHTHTSTFTNTAPSLCLIYTYGQRDPNPDLNTPSKLPQCSECLVWLQGLLGKASQSVFKKQSIPSSQAVLSLTRVSLCLFSTLKVTRNENSTRTEARFIPCPGLPDPGKHVKCLLNATWDFRVPYSLYYTFSYLELYSIPTCRIQYFWTPSFISLCYQLPCLGLGFMVPLSFYSTGVPGIWSAFIIGCLSMLPLAFSMLISQNVFTILPETFFPVLPLRHVLFISFFSKNYLLLIFSYSISCSSPATSSVSL